MILSLNVVAMNKRKSFYMARQYRALYEDGCRLLQEAGIEEAKLDARLLLEFVCRTDRNALLVHGDQEVSKEDTQRYMDALAKRSSHIPLQHITGVQDFMGLTFHVSEHVLIPRQDTEILVEEAMKKVHDGMSILDICTGSGCILISLLHYSNQCKGVGTDLSEDALAVARKNAEELLNPHGNTNEVLIDEFKDFTDGLPEDTLKVATFVQGDLLENIEGKFDVIVSNPPYIRSDVIDTLMPEVKDHEPKMALDGFEDGLYFYRRIVSEAKSHMFRGAWLFFEIGYDQGEAVKSLMEQSGYGYVEVIQDYAGLDRVVFGMLLEDE